jgi:hypothetical protein
MSALSVNKLDGLKRIIALGVYSQTLIRMIFFLTFVQVRGGSIVVKNSFTGPAIGGSNLAAAQPKSKEKILKAVQCRPVLVVQW